MTRNLRLHPEIFRSGLLGFSAYVVHHPEYVGHVLSSNARNYVKFEKYRYLRYIGGNGLVTNEGESWVRQRRLVQPAFRRDALDRSLPLIVDETAAMIARLRDPAGMTVDIAEVMAELTLAIAARSLFSSDVGGSTALIRNELDVAQRRGNVLLRIPLPLYRVAPWIPYLNRPVRSGHVLRGVVARIIDARRASPNPPDDLLTTLLAARDDASNEGMTDEQLRDEVLTLLLGGHETTLHAMTWSFYLLAQDLAASERLSAEADGIGDRTTTTTGELESLRWAAAVAREALRLYPPVYIIGRTAIDDDRLEPFAVPSGTNVMVNIYGLHRHPAYWSDPDAFRPERMLDPAAYDPARLVYIPFGAGPRGCIGFRFSLYEMQVILTMFARAFRLELVSRVPVVPSPQFTLKSAAPVRLRLVPR